MLQFLRFVEHLKYRLLSTFFRSYIVQNIYRIPFFWFSNQTKLHEVLAHVTFFFSKLSLDSFDLCFKRASFLQSGKSAAIYACAKEQGFQVIEVLINTCCGTVVKSQHSLFLVHSCNAKTLLRSYQYDKEILIYDYEVLKFS